MDAHTKFIPYRKQKDFLLRVIAILIPPFLRDFLIAVGNLGRVADWYRKHDRPKYKDKKDFFDGIIDQENMVDEVIIYLEFGVIEGRSFREWLQSNHNPNSRFYGFDTFTGLPDDWGIIKKGTWSTGGKPPDMGDDRCEMIKGLFQDTLPLFLDTHNLDKRLVINVDSDLYSSALFILTALVPRFKEGDIIIFDDFVLLSTPTNGEFRAFFDFLSAYHLDYKFIGTTLVTRAAFKICTPVGKNSVEYRSTEIQ